MDPSASLDRKTLLKMLVESPLPSSANASQLETTSKPKVSLKAPVTIDATESLTELLSKLKGFASEEDPAATEGIWRLCTKAKTALPSGDRLENLSWRLLHMSLRKKKEKEEEAASLSASLKEPKLEPASPSMSDFFDMSLSDESTSASEPKLEFNPIVLPPAPTPSAPTAAIFSKQPIPPPQVNKKSQLSFGGGNITNSNAHTSSSVPASNAFGTTPGFEHAFKPFNTYSPSADQMMISTNTPLPLDMELDKQFDMLFDNPTPPVNFNDFFNFAQQPLFYSSTAPAAAAPIALSSSLSSLQYSNTVFSSTDSLANMYSQTPPPVLNNPMSPISESPSPSSGIREQSQSPLQQQRSASHKQLHTLQQQHHQFQQQQQHQQLMQRKTSSSSLGNNGKMNGTTEQTCFNCATTNTPMWRRDLQGRSVCNACGVYFRVNGVNRVVKHGGTAVKRRVRVKEAPANGGLSSSEMRRVLSVPDLKPNSSSLQQQQQLKQSLPRNASGSHVSVSSSLGKSFETAGSASDLSIDQNPQVGSLKRARFDV
ncbi:UNVERIFIED_CONTAM: putative electron transfer flavoprotein subunit [Siphonaria sp. JEL0065]|nr:putative electron transfer flavoprotein subunit [Siphonaria sp. JEL0065]